MITSEFEEFGNYLILRKLATGGMAEVFLARPRSSLANGRLLVIKRILPSIAGEASFMKMFRSEIEVCMGFCHANTVQIFDFGEINGRPFLAMEYIEGQDLRQVLNRLALRKLRMKIEMAVSLVAQAAAGLHYAHRFRNRLSDEHLGIIHRDISPHNLILNYDGNLKIIDFGVAKSLNRPTDMTRTGTIKGKIDYLSPEQATGVEVDPRTDIFMAGLVFWELLTGRKVFNLEGVHSTAALEIIKNCEKSIKPPSTFCPGLPPELDSIVMKALAQNPSDRFPTALDFQKSLRGFLTRYKPNYGYSDVGQEMSRLFNDERTVQIKHNRQVNELAQGYLVEESTTRTIGQPLQVLSPSVPTGIALSESAEQYLKILAEQFQRSLSKKSPLARLLSWKLIFHVFLLLSSWLALDLKFDLADRIANEFNWVVKKVYVQSPMNSTRFKFFGFGDRKPSSR